MLKSKPQKDQSVFSAPNYIPEILKNISKNVKISHTQQSKNLQCLAPKKITRYAKRQNEDKNQSSVPEMTQMMEVVDTDIKTVIKTIFHMFKKVGLLKYPKRDRIYFCKLQIEYEELKNDAMSEMKNILNGINR